MSEAVLSRVSFGDGWIGGREFTPEEAWLDLIQLADLAGVLPVVSLTERWGWDMDRVHRFFKALQKHGHIRPHDKNLWCLCYQGQDVRLLDEYEQVWRIYPKRVAKQKGYHAYSATRKGRNGKPGVSARLLFEAAVKYAGARHDEEAQYIMNPDTFFGTSERWKEKVTPRTNTKSKGKQQWKRPTSRDLTKTPEAQTKGRSPTKKRTQTSPMKKKPPPKKTPRKKDPLGDL